MGLSRISQRRMNKMQRYFINESLSDDHQITLPKDVAHHFVTVLRANEGDQCELVLNDHQAYQCTLIDVEHAIVQVQKQLKQNAELPLQVTLACGLPKTKDKPELIVQKGTELGVTEVIFFESDRSVSHWNNGKQSKKIARLQKIADGAAEQSHRNLIPQIKYLPNLATLLEEVQADKKVVAWEESAKQGETSRLAQMLNDSHPNEKWLAIFGPEGGLSEQEISQMKTYQVQPVGLGPRILRTETAPLYFMSAVSFATELNH